MVRETASMSVMAKKNCMLKNLQWTNDLAVFIFKDIGAVTL